MLRKEFILIYGSRSCIIPRTNLKIARKIFIKFPSFLKFLERVWKQSNSSFLFSLKNKDNLAPFISDSMQGQERYAIYCHSDYGPRFGVGNDLHIRDNPQLGHSYSKFGLSYQLPPGYVYGSNQAETLLAGQYQFTTTEIEVFN